VIIKLIETTRLPSFFITQWISFVPLSLLFILPFLFSPNLIAAEDNELSLKQMLLSPGDLTKGHEEIENKCQSCHVHFEKSNQTALCLDCHEKVDEDIKLNNGLHGLMSESQREDCNLCHTDHQGRDFDITGLDMDNFEHAKTNFPLDGSHKNKECSSCHTNQGTQKHRIENLSTELLELPVDKGYRFKAFECSSCHVDFHQEKLGNECESCHSTESWRMEQFDHDETNFQLDGKHKNLECESCHIDNQFKEVERECQSCHLANDSHLGVFGEKCVDCHTTEKWRNDSYNHFKETGYRLKDSHFKIKGQRVKCISCHAEELKPNTQCITCHKADDVHQSGNGEKCQDCHNQKSWNKTDFTHDKVSTGFELLGKHKETSCDSCHVPGEKRNSQDIKTVLVLVRACVDCHKVDDPHFGKLGKECGDCHSENDWQKSVRFNHDFTDFPLTASHQLLVCESCHSSSEFSHESQKCISCHQSDDIHKKTLGEGCGACHDTSVWSHWQFDHQQQTKFPLNGAHQNLKCELCHSSDQPEALQPTNDCYSCHREDDTHNGGFGVECQQCHTEDSFEELDF